MQASPHRKFSNIRERKAFFFKVYGAKINRNSDFTEAGFHLWSLFAGTHAAMPLGTHGRTERSEQILILIKLPEKVSAEGDFTLR